MELERDSTQEHLPERGTELHGLAARLAANEATVGQAPVDFSRMLYMSFLGLDTQISIADTKAQLIMTANTILIASMVIAPGSLGALLSGQTLTLRDSVVTLLLLGMGASLVYSIYNALRSSGPRMTASRRPNLFFFGHVAAMTEEDFEGQFMQMNMLDVKSAVLRQIYAKSVIVQRKYRHIHIAIRFLFLALGLWLVARIIGAL
jgi:hypothetical protein